MRNKFEGGMSSPEGEPVGKSFERKDFENLCETGRDLRLSVVDYDSQEFETSKSIGGQAIGADRWAREGREKAQAKFEEHLANCEVCKRKDREEKS